MLSESQQVETYKVLGLVAMYSGGGHKVAWAMSLLEQGVDTKNLAVLATFIQPLNEFEVEDYFQRVLRELGIRQPCAEEAIEGYAKALAKEVIDGELAPEVGASMIYQANVQAGYPESFGEYTVLDDEWYCECINGWSKQQRREEIIKACRETYAALRYPGVFTD